MKIHDERYSTAVFRSHDKYQKEVVKCDLYAQHVRKLGEECAALSSGEVDYREVFDRMSDAIYGKGSAHRMVVVPYTRFFYIYVPDPYEFPCKGLLTYLAPVVGKVSMHGNSPATISLTHHSIKEGKVKAAREYIAQRYSPLTCLALMLEGAEIWPVQHYRERGPALYKHMEKLGITFPSSSGMWLAAQVAPAQEEAFAAYTLYCTEQMETLRKAKSDAITALQQEVEATRAEMLERKEVAELIKRAHLADKQIKVAGKRLRELQQEAEYISDKLSREVRSTPEVTALRTRIMKFEKEGHDKASMKRLYALLDTLHLR